MTDTVSTTAVQATLDAWADTEIGGDPAAVASMLTDDFTGVGPLGFVLTRDEWIDRHASGALRYDALRFTETVADRHWVTDRWLVAHVHTSFIAGTPGAPPIPGQDRARDTNPEDTP